MAQKKDKSHSSKVESRSSKVSCETCFQKGLFSDGASDDRWKDETLEKLILGVSVNCAMQPAECGRLQVDDFLSSIQKQVRSEIGFYSTAKDK